MLRSAFFGPTIKCIPSLEFIELGLPLLKLCLIEHMVLTCCEAPFAIFIDGQAAVSPGRDLELRTDHYPLVWKSGEMGYDKVQYTAVLQQILSEDH
jgi:hypothetical protein